MTLRKFIFRKFILSLTIMLGLVIVTALDGREFVEFINSPLSLSLTYVVSLILALFVSWGEGSSRNGRRSRTT